MKYKKHTVENEQISDDTHFEEKIEKEQVENTLEQNETVESSDETDKLADELEALKLKNEELNDKNLRMMAEFDNYRKRTMKEKADLIKSAGEMVFTDILPLMDDFERALKAMETSEDIDAVKEGIDLIYGKFASFLNSHGVKEITTDNEKFNVDVHEAITTFPVQDEDKRGKIIDCVSKGYMLNDKVIRFAKVVVGE